jgi:hypothetical protein
VEIWLAVFMLPLIGIAIGAAILGMVQRLISSTTILTMLLSRLASVVVLGLLVGFGLVVVAGFVALWRMAPLISIFGLIFLVANGSFVWVQWRRHHDDPLNYQR